MKKTLVALFCLFIITEAGAQVNANTNLDSLYNAFVAMHPSFAEAHGIRVQSADTAHMKCGFGLATEVKLNFDNFSYKQKLVIQQIMSRPATDTSIITPDGHFRIHYNLSGSSAPSYDVNQLALALDSVYNFEITYLGYPFPPSDNGAGGDDKYDVYIVNLAVDYGYTQYETLIPGSGGRYISFMEIDNDFAGYNYYTHGIDAARVTVAHEFHHAIQMGDYILRFDDLFFYELTSTSMEEFVFSTVNDYYSYIKSFFNNTDASFANTKGYDRAIWNIFLKDQFGYGIIKKQWELMPKMRAMQAISNSLADYNSSFAEELNKFGVWCYFTGYRAISGMYFKEAANYPLIRPITTIDYINSFKAIKLNTGAVSNSYIEFNNGLNRDTLFAIITNADIKNGIDSVTAYFPFEYNLSGEPIPGGVKLTKDYFAKFSADKPSFWLTSEVLNNAVVDSGTFIANQVSYAFPSPFNYKTNTYLNIPVKPDEFGYADLNIYSSGMKLVYSSQVKAAAIYGQKVIRWNGKTNDGQKLPSGVYIFVTKSGDNISKGKLVIFNE